MQHFGLAGQPKSPQKYSVSGCQRRPIKDLDLIKNILAGSQRKPAHLKLYLHKFTGSKYQ